MIPETAVNGATLDAFLVYVSMLGILLLIATWLRLKIPFLKKYYIPASLIAGVIGLILGPHFVGLIPAHVTACWSALSGRLIVIVFAPMLMGRRTQSAKTLFKTAGGSIIWSYVATFMQYAIPLLLGAFLLTPLFGVNPLFGTIVEQGWAGGHGTAGGMALVFEELGWLDGQSLSVTSATIGLVFGVVAGIAMINIGVRKGWTAILQKSAGLTNTEDELFTGDRQPVCSRDAVSSSVINSYAFHGALISVAIFIGWILNFMLKKYLNFSVSWFVTALFGGLLLNLVIGRTRWGEAIDSGTMNNIQGISLEFLVAGAVASVNVPVVVEYAMPLLIQQLAAMALMLFLNLWLARRIFGQYWFENSMVLFGTYCGVAATGLLLLKTCDPNMKSGAGEVFAARAPFCGWALGGGVLTSMTPVWVVQYGALKVGLAYLIGAVLFSMLFRFAGCWYPVSKAKTPQSN